MKFEKNLFLDIKLFRGTLDNEGLVMIRDTDYDFQFKGICTMTK